MHELVNLKLLVGNNLARTLIWDQRIAVRGNTDLGSNPYSVPLREKKSEVFKAKGKTCICC